MKIKIESTPSGDTVTRTIPPGHTLNFFSENPIIETYEGRGIYVYQIMGKSADRQVCYGLDHTGHTLTVDRDDPGSLVSVIRRESKRQVQQARIESKKFFGGVS